MFEMLTTDPNTESQMQTKLNNKKKWNNRDDIVCSIYFFLHFFTQQHDKTFTLIYI